MLLTWAALKIFVNYAIMVSLYPIGLKLLSLLCLLMVFDPLPLAIESQNSVIMIEFHRLLLAPLIDVLFEEEEEKNEEKNRKN